MDKDKKKDDVVTTILKYPRRQGNQRTGNLGDAMTQAAVNAVNKGK